MGFLLQKPWQKCFLTGMRRASDYQACRVLGRGLPGCWEGGRDGTAQGRMLCFLITIVGLAGEQAVLQSGGQLTPARVGGFNGTRLVDDSSADSI